MATISTACPLLSGGQIEAVQIPYTVGNEDWTVTNLSRKVFALSGTEFGQADSNMKVEGTALANAATLKIVTNSVGTARPQWTRSPFTSYATSAWHLSNVGKLTGYLCTGNEGARPAFTLPDGCAISTVPNPDGSYNLA